MYNIELLRKALATVSVVALAIIGGCESTTSSSGQGGASGSSVSSGAGGSAGMSGAGGVGGEGGSNGPLWPECANSVFAVDKILFGDTDPDGTDNFLGGWAQYGFNIDERTSTSMSTDLCMPAAGASKAQVYKDGNDGIDNSFGKNVVSILLGLTFDMSKTNNEAIAKGELTYLLSLADLGQSACTLPNALFLGGNLGQAALFDGSDVWPIDKSSLTNAADPMSAKCTFPDTKIDMGLVQAGPPSQFSFILIVDGYKMALPVHHMRIAMQLGPDEKSATAGQIGGIINREDLVNEMAKFAGSLDSSLCDPNSPTLISILNQVRQAADILQDGTQDPAKECDGISIGLGFTMKAAQLGKAVSPEPAKDPCVP